jgi:hypothetical protein
VGKAARFVLFTPVPQLSDNERVGEVVSGDTVLETEDLTKDFAGFVAVRSVNLRVARGSVHAMIGPNTAATSPRSGRRMWHSLELAAHFRSPRCFHT